MFCSDCFRVAQGTSQGFASACTAAPCISCVSRTWLLDHPHIIESSSIPKFEGISSSESSPEAAAWPRRQLLGCRQSSPGLTQQYTSLDMFRVDDHRSGSFLPVSTLNQPASQLTCASLCRRRSSSRPRRFSNCITSCS